MEFAKFCSPKNIGTCQLFLFLNIGRQHFSMFFSAKNFRIPCLESFPLSRLLICRKEGERIVLAMKRLTSSLNLVSFPYFPPPKIGHQTNLTAKLCTAISHRTQGENGPFSLHPHKCSITNCYTISFLDYRASFVLRCRKKGTNLLFDMRCHTFDQRVFFFREMKFVIFVLIVPQ